MKFRLASCAVLTLLSISCRQKTNDKSVNESEFERRIDSLRLAHHIPGISIGVSMHDSIILNKGFGLSHIEEDIPMTGETPLRIASLTKPIFASLFMKSLEENRIDLNWKIKDHYPNYEEKCIRILQYFEEEEPEYAFLLNKYDFKRDDILLWHHLSHTAEKVPGTEFKYNGFLYGMLSDVMETTTGITFDKMIDSLVISELELKQAAASQLDINKTKVLEKIAKPYKVDSEKRFIGNDFPNKELNAGAGLVFSCHDLLLFDEALNKNILISEKSKMHMFEPMVLADGSKSPYGYGWFVQKYKGYTLVWHYGLQPDTYSGLYLKVLEKNMTFVALANGQNLSEEFNLGEGDVLKSPFAVEFLNSYLLN